MASTLFLPHFHRISTTFVLILLAELLAFVLTLASTQSADQFWSTLGLNSLFVLWITLLTVFVLSIGERWWRRLPVKFACMVVLAVLMLASFSALWVVDRVLGEGGGVFIWIKTPLIALVCGGLWLRYQYMVFLRRLQSQSEATARLDALQARMRPHFLFNSLNAIASLLTRDARQAEDLLLDLAELFRVILKQDQRLTSLKDEVALARQYLNIEQQRLGDRMRIRWQVDTDAEAGLLPPLSLQPLLENAVYHGIETSSDAGFIEVNARLRRDRLIITVVNSVPLAREASVKARLGNKFALQNLRLRMENCFGGDAVLQTSMVDDRFQTRLVIPFRTEAF